MILSKLTASPTVPRPNIATLEPDSTFAVFQTAPRPRRQNTCITIWVQHILHHGKHFGTPKRFWCIYIKVVLVRKILFPNRELLFLHCKQLFRWFWWNNYFRSRNKLFSMQEQCYRYTKTTLVY